MKNKYRNVLYILSLSNFVVYPGNLALVSSGSLNINSITFLNRIPEILRRLKIYSGKSSI